MIEHSHLKAFFLFFFFVFFFWGGGGGGASFGRCLSAMLEIPNFNTERNNSS